MESGGLVEVGLRARLCRGDEWGRGRPIRQADERNNIDDTDLARIFAYIDVLGLPRD
jgi:hypothetical protein